MDEEEQCSDRDLQSSPTRPAKNGHPQSNGVEENAPQPVVQRFGSNVSPAVEATSEASSDTMVPVQETCPFDDEPHIVYGRTMLLMPLSNRSKDYLLQTKVNPQLRGQVRALEEAFANLVFEVQQELCQVENAVRGLRTYLVTLAATFRGTVTLFDEKTVNLIQRKENDVGHIFSYLSSMRAWDFLNFRLLTLIIARFSLSQAFHSRVQDYTRRVEEFKRDTKLIEFLDFWSLSFKGGDESLPNCQLLVAKLQASFTSFTLADLAEKQRYIANEFLLRDYVLRFDYANEGCIVLFWYVPETIVDYMKETYLNRKPDLAQAGVIELAIGDHIIFQAQDSEEPVSRMISHYDEYYKYSITHPKKFWAEMAVRTLIWEEPFNREKVMDGCNMKEGKITFFAGQKINASVNCLDRHVAASPDKVAVIWDNNEGSQTPVTYKELLDMTCRIANVLKKYGVKKGDRVIIYMPQFPKAIASMLACARIGAVHSVVFAVLQPNDLRSRIEEAQARVILTANEAVIGEKHLNLKSNVDEAVPLSDESEDKYVVLVAKRTDKEINTWNKRDHSLEEEMEQQSPECEPVAVDGEDPLFVKYTSGSTSMPTDFVHSTAGYLLQVALTHKYVFDYKPGDIFGCVAELGWITGHSYVVYGPLCNGGTTLLFEGTASYPKRDRYWEMIDRLSINQFYTTPSAIRGLMKDPDHLIDNYQDRLGTLKTIGTVGETLNNDACEWYFKKVGHEKCTVVDTWWQTEMGAISIVVKHQPSTGRPSKSAFPSKPFFGVQPCIIDPETKSEVTTINEEGYLYLKQPIPSMVRKSLDSKQLNLKWEYIDCKRDDLGMFFTYDKARICDAEGGYKITGRVDDAIRLQGVWLDVTEIESVMNKSDDRIQETSLVQINSLKKSTESEPTGICAFVELRAEIKIKDPAKCCEIITKLRKECENSNVPKEGIPTMFIFMDEQFVTHSGKIVRSFLREIIDMIQRILSICSPKSTKVTKKTEDGTYTMFTVDQRLVLVHG